MPSGNHESRSTQTHSVVSSLDDKIQTNGMSLSMHDGVEVWCDCCSCEAEPYWLEAFAKQEPTKEKG